MQKRTIDINCDLGEGMAHDAEILPFISSVNIACGFHAGDLATMERLVIQAYGLGVAIGAHPSYSDREHFGRRVLQVEPEILSQQILEQIETLQAICKKNGALLHHVKPHGALYNQSVVDENIASVIVRAVRQSGPHLIIYGMKCGELEGAAAKAGQAFAGEVFADRNYQSDGQLVPRNMPDALITDPEAAAKHALQLCHQQDGAATICFHGDGSTALEIAKILKVRLEQAGITIKAP